MSIGVESAHLAPEGARADRFEILGAKPMPLPPPGTAHQEAVGALYLALRTWADPARAGRVLLSPVVVRFADTDVVQPDLVFVATARLDVVAADGLYAAPDLVIEVVAPATAERDRVLKCSIYERYAVPEYWIVDPEAKTVQVLTRGADGLRPRRLMPYAAILTAELTPGATGLATGARRSRSSEPRGLSRPTPPSPVPAWRRLAASEPGADGAEADSPHAPVGSGTTLGEPAAPEAAWEAVRVAFVTWCRQRDLGASTLDAYAEDVEAFARWYRSRTEAGPLQPAAISVSDILAYRSHMTARYKPSTTNRRLFSLRWFFTVAQARGEVARNPAANIRSVPNVELGPRALRREELRRLLAAASRSSQRDATLVVLLANTGLRISEALGLTWADVTTADRGAKAIIRHGKGRRYREVPLNLTARSYLREWSAVCWPDDPPPEAHVFRGSRGQQLPVRTVQEALYRQSARAGLDPVVTPHVLRHTFCKMLIDLGVSLDRVATLAGHAWLDSTVRYTLATPEDLAADVSRLDWS